MKKIKLEDCSPKDILSGIYKIDFPSGKMYIGLSNNIRRRIIEHNNEFRNNLPIEFAIKKYGKIKEFILLEEIPAENRTLMQKREQYWINFYNATDRNIGYNISKGGDGANFGTNNHEAKLTEETYQEIVDCLKNRLDLSLSDISKIYGLNLSTISRLNNGHTYFHSSINYPIRHQQGKKGSSNCNSYLSEEIIQQIINELKKDSLTMKEISIKFNTSPTIIRNINIGKTYYNSQNNYPIRAHHKTGSKKLSDKDVLDIIKEIKNNPNESLASIGRRLNISSKIISSINCGTTYKQKNMNYPIRKSKRL